MNFAKDVENHSMTIEADNGVHRSLRFGEGNSFCHYFRINTWPGHLCISGDMGTYVFSRTEDMFRFFRGDAINLGYWSEKIQSESLFGSGVREYKPEILVASVMDWVERCDPEAKEEIEEDLIPQLEGVHEAEAIRAIYEYRGKVCFSDFICDLGSHCYSDYTVHFVWCCEAIRWAIEVYDAETSVKCTAYPVNGCAHPQFCKDGCNGRPASVNGAPK